jgi:hypothetical protein
VLGPNTPAVDVIAAVGRVDRLRAVGVSVGSDAAEESAHERWRRSGTASRRCRCSAAAPGCRTARPPAGAGWATDADQLDTLLTDRA